MSKPYFVSPAEGRVTSGWGHRAPLPYHYGIDIAPPVPGTRDWPVYAAYGGRVAAVEDDARPGRNGRYGGNPITGTYNTGNYVKIDGRGPKFGEGLGSEWYGHLDRIYVKPGDTVEAGDLIGTMGASGNVSGIHLHFETWDRHTRSPHNPMIDFNRHGVKPGSKPARTGKAKKRVATPGAHVKPDGTIRNRLRAMGYDYPDDGLLSTWVGDYQDAQLYKPGLVADGIWGPMNEAHYKWVLTLQREMEKWRGNVKPARDGDYRRVTAARVREIQTRNMGGAYRGKLDGIPGPVFCRMLGINRHPGL